jgi:hypothetical protein
MAGKGLQKDDPHVRRLHGQNTAVSQATRCPRHGLGRPVVKNILEAETRAPPIGLVVVARKMPVPTETKYKLLNSSERIDAWQSWNGSRDWNRRPCGTGQFVAAGFLACWPRSIKLREIKKTVFHDNRVYIVHHGYDIDSPRSRKEIFELLDWWQMWKDRIGDFVAKWMHCTHLAFPIHTFIWLWN